ncbi:MAG: SusC/RagA family TonB-linked outer membrane protein, partial [Prevotella sp.]
MNFSLKRTTLLIILSLTGIVAIAQRHVKGNIKDSHGEPMIGVSILVDGKSVAVTDIDGNFSIGSVNPSSYIDISYIGYKSLHFKAGRQDFLNLTMEEASEMLDDVVVVGYGTMKKIDFTGSVSSVGNEKLNEKGASSVLANLQGTVAGVNITQATGRTGGAMNIEIRGKNSISGSQSPLYVVDGIICSDIEFLNPQDIERIDVLKDASSTAIYGSRATAGVVMVTTKSGAGSSTRNQKPTISYDGYFGTAVIARMPDFMDAGEFYQYRFMKFLTMAGGDALGGKPIWVNTDLDRCLLLKSQSDPNSGYVMKELLASGKTYDWPDFVLQNGQQQNHYLSVSGANDKINYQIGIGYTKEEGHYRNDAQDKFTIKGSVDAEINKFITAGLSVNMARQNHDYASSDAVRYALRSNPFMQPYDEQGNPTYKPGHRDVLGTDMYQFTDQISPLVYMDDQKSNKLGWNVLA